MLTQLTYGKKTANYQYNEDQLMAALKAHYRSGMSNDVDHNSSRTKLGNHKVARVKRS